MTRTVGLAAGLAAVVVAAAVAIVVVLSAGNRTAFADLEPGDCFDLAGAIAEASGEVAPFTAVDTVSCGEPHDAEVVAVGALNPDGDRDYPSDGDLIAELDRVCAARVPAEVDLDRFGVLPIAPDERTWTDRDGRYACVAVVIGGGTVERSALG